jgi:hypothetical protein
MIAWCAPNRERFNRRRQLTGGRAPAPAYIERREELGRMSDQVSLDAQGLRDALAILQREQAAYLPTERELTFYRWFSIFAYSTAASVGLVIALGVVSDDIQAGTMSVVFEFLSIAALVTMFATIVLFALNTSLIRKLYRLAKLRKRLNLADYVAEALYAARHPLRRFVTTMTHVVSLVGWLLIIGAFLGGVAVVFTVLDEGTSPITLGSIYLATFVVGVSFISFRYIRRGKHQLEVVLRLQRTLTDHAAEPEVKLSTDDYQAIASLERQHIIRDRATSIATARRNTNEPGYLCQTSRQMSLAKGTLPPELLVEVEKTIAELLVDPLSAAGSDHGTEKSIPVAGTGLRIQYDIDSARHLVRLHDLQAEAGTSATALRGADGLS